MKYHSLPKCDSFPRHQKYFFPANTGKCLRISGWRASAEKAGRKPCSPEMCPSEYNSIPQIEPIIHKIVLENQHKASSSFLHSYFITYRVSESKLNTSLLPVQTSPAMILP